MQKKKKGPWRRAKDNATTPKLRRLQETKTTKMKVTGKRKTERTEGRKEGREEGRSGPKNEWEREKGRTELRREGKRRGKEGREPLRSVGKVRGGQHGTCMYGVCMYMYVCAC